MIISELLNMGPDFVYGFINAMDGERDPRILLYLYEFLPEFLKTFPLGHLNSETFEVIACYFPIDFHPSPSDAAAITRGQLAEKLSDCLCGHETFAEECINLLIEKLDSQLSVAKLDSLYLLSKAAVKFPPVAIEKQFPDIWKALRAELLPGPNKEITMATLDALQVLLVNCAKEQQVVENMLAVIVAALVPILSDVNSRLFAPAAAIALKCADTGRLAAKVVTRKTLPAFLLQINADAAEQQVQRGTLIELSAQLLAMCIECEVIDQIDSKLVETAQFEFCKCLVPRSDTDTEKLIQIALQALAKIAAVVVDSNRILVYRAINSYLLETGAANAGRDAVPAIDCTAVLSAFAARFPDEVSTEIVAHILNMQYICEKLSLAAIAELFENLCCLIAIRKFREEILAFLFHNIFDSDDAIKPEQRNEIRLIGIRVLHHILTDDKNEQLHEEMYTKYNIIDRFQQMIQSKQLNDPNSDHLNSVDDFLCEMSQILQIILKAMDANTQTQLVERYLASINLQVKADLYFAMGLLGYLEPSVDLENHFERLTDELTQLALHTDDPEMATLSNQLLCSLFNKCPDNDKHTNILKKIIKLLKDELKKHNKKAVEILSWVSKGLLTRGHKEASELIDTVSFGGFWCQFGETFHGNPSFSLLIKTKIQLIELLEHPTLSEAAVAAFDVLSIEFPQLHLPVIKHFFKQKLFQMCLKGLWHKLESYSENHMSAFIFVLKLTPHQVLKNEIQKVTSKSNCQEAFLLDFSFILFNLSIFRSDQSY